MSSRSATTRAMLEARARLMAQTRAFFDARGVLEVETPLLGTAVVVEASIDPLPCKVTTPNGREQRYLLSSPEGPMKRLLAAGSGAIYQFAKAFRDGELGRRHAIEFTMLEWYRPGFDHGKLMTEVEALACELLPEVTCVERLSYRQLFVEHAGIDPFATSHGEIREACSRFDVAVPDGFDREPLDDALDLLLIGFEHRIGRGGACFVHGYPPSQAALAQIGPDDRGCPVARRFELYVDGVELANGYHELVDAAEQRERFEQANDERATRNRSRLPPDEELLTAMEQGLPACAGVALGFDRLVMLATGAADIRDVQLP